MSHAERRAIARLELFDAQGARIRNEHGEPLWGTAFLTGSRFALTAYHVVADRRRSDFVLKAHRFELVFVRAGGVRIAVRTPVAALADRDLDAVLLELEQDPPSDVEPLVSTGDVVQHAPFSAWGFAGLNPIDGLELSGRVEDPAATVEGKPAVQLFSLQAAAPHARVAGLSGGPCFVDGRVIGIVRSYLERDGAAVGGTVYASPLAPLLTRPAFAQRIRVDPCADLPPLPDDYPWPDEPFRDLLPFGASDARVFFGRCTELSRLRRAIEDRASRVVLLYGQTGVGKSSLLHAGLVPRLSHSWDVRYARRDASVGILQTFKGLSAAPRAGRPCLFLLDQVEEIITRPLGDAERELTDLAFALASHAAERPDDRVVLGFRKEWLSDVERALATQRVARESVPLLPMGPAAVEEVVLGLERSPRMKERYQLDIEANVATQVARVLCADRQSAIAPALQVLLTKLWRAAGERSRSPRRVDTALFEAVSRDGLGLGAVLDQRLASVSVGPGPRGLGLVLDLLRLHVTKAGTSALVTRTQRADVYAERAAEAESAVRELVSAYLLVDAREDGDSSAGDTALAHDALGPLVLSRFAGSELPGPRARRTLENRTGGEALDAYDLDVVERGLPAMRAPTPSERQLIAASRARRRRDRITRRALLGVFALLGLAALAGGARAYLSSRDLAEEVHTRALSQAALQFNEGLRAEQERGEPLGVLRRLARAVELAPEDDPRLGEYITKLVHTAAAGPSIVSMVPAQAEILAASYANGRLAVLTLANVLRIYRLDDHGAVRGLEAVEIADVQLDQRPQPATLALDPAGQRALVGETPQAILIELREGEKPRKIDLGASGHPHSLLDLQSSHVTKSIEHPTAALPGCGVTKEGDWVLWVGKNGDLLCRAEGWLLGSASGHVGFARGTHTNIEAHVHDGALDRPPLLQVVDAAGKRLLELWATGELRAWSLDAPPGTSLSSATRRPDSELEERTRKRVSRDGRFRLKDDDALLVVDQRSAEVVLRLGDAAAPDADVFEALFVRATRVTVSPESNSTPGRIELTRAVGELPIVAWKLNSHTLMRVGDSDVAPPSLEYDDFVLSRDGRFGAAIARHDPSIRLWRNRTFPRLDEVRRGPDKAYWLSARERLPGSIADAGFEEREGILRLWTLLTDGTLREHYVSEPFGARPRWTAELPRLLGGAIGPNDALQVPLPQAGNARIEALKSFSDDTSYAAGWLFHRFFEAP